MSATDWITLGTKVIIYSRSTYPNSYFNCTWIVGITGGKFTVEGLDAEFKIGPAPASTGKRDRWTGHLVAPLDSDIARELLRQDRIEKLYRGALIAVTDWRAEMNPRNPALLDAAITALQAFRGAL